MRGALMQTHTATVKKIVQAGKDITTIYFCVPEFTYAAGQYITVFFPNTSHPEGKAYSLSSAPHQTLQSITVKRVGEFSGLLCSLRPGDTFTCSPAYGHFYTSTDTSLVCLAGGVGIAPLWSVIKTVLRHEPQRTVTLAYSAATATAMPHRDSIVQLACQCPQFHVRQHITRHTTRIQGALAQRICPSDYIQDGARYLLCGSVTFVRDMWRELTDCGVAPEHISTEVFFE